MNDIFHFIRRCIPFLFADDLKTVFAFFLRDHNITVNNLNIDLLPMIHDALGWRSS